MKSNNKMSTGGRPPKFLEKSRPVTVTLPERTIRKLESVSDDRAKAIVKCVDSVVGHDGNVHKPVELVEVAPGKAIIIVGPSKALRKISWLGMVEIAPARYLLSIPTGVSTEMMEVTIRDLILDLRKQQIQERVLLEDLCSLLGHHRRRATVSKGEMFFVDI